LCKYIRNGVKPQGKAKLNTTMVIQDGRSKKRNKKRKREFVETMDWPAERRKKKTAYASGKGGDFMTSTELNLQDQRDRAYREIETRILRQESHRREIGKRELEIKSLSQKIAQNKDFFSRDSQLLGQTKPETKALQKRNQELKASKLKEEKAFKDKYNKSLEMNRKLKQKNVGSKKFRRVMPKKPKVSKAARAEKERKYQAINLPEHLKSCDVILKQIEKDPNAWVFAEGVDVAKYPDYLEVVQRPMCLTQVKANLYNGIYAGIAQFGKDLRQIFINAKAYNPAAHQVHQWAVKMEQKFQRLYNSATRGQAPQGPSDVKMSAKPTRAEINEVRMKLNEAAPSVTSKLVKLMTEYDPRTTHGGNLSIDLDNLPNYMFRKIQKLIKQGPAGEKRIPNNPRRNRQRIMRNLESLKGTTNPQSLGNLRKLPPPTQTIGVPFPLTFNNRF